MLFPKRKDIVLPQTAPAGTGSQTIRFLIKQERRRLEAFSFRLTMTCVVGAATGAAWGGFAGIVKEIRLVVNDGPAGGGQRNLIQVSGTALLACIRQWGLNIDRATQVGYASSGFPAGSNQQVQMTFYVPIRHPAFQEPIGNVLAYPLSSTYTANDVYVEVDLNDIGAGGTVFTANPPTYSATVTPALVQTHLVEVPDSFPYLRSELRTDTGFGPNATGNVPYEFTSGGFMTGFLVQGFSAALGNAVTRQSLLSVNGQMRVEYGREVMLKTDEHFQTALNDLSTQLVYPNLVEAIGAGTGTIQNRMFPLPSAGGYIAPDNGETYFDFLTDLPGLDAFSLASCLDLNTDALGGDKCRLVFNDLASTTRPIHITTHKILSSRAQVTSVVNSFAKQGVTA